MKSLPFILEVREKHCVPTVVHTSIVEDISGQFLTPFCLTLVKQ